MRIFNLVKQRTANVIVVDNVAEYVAQNWSQNDRAISVPTMAPPFSDFWMEYRVPVSDRASPLFRIEGFQVVSIAAEFEVVDAFEHGSVLSEFDEAARKAGVIEAHTNSRWILCARLYRGYSNGWFHGFDFVFQYHLGADGEILGRTLIGPDAADCGEAADYCLWPFAVAIAFTHCKNVAIRTEAISAKLAKARAKRGRSPGLMKWHVLEIEPMKYVLRTEGHSDSSGIKQALHICRGHFKDYRQSGLFGKVKGIFWWDSTLRGSSKEGVVIKDYDVKAPTK